MDSKLTFSLIILALGVVFVSGCAKVSEPWDKTGYFKEERSRSAEQQERLQHRLAHFREASRSAEQQERLQHRLAHFREAGSDQPWTHAQQ
jgi:hypothetical protein